jgi:hypothetical protein
MFKVWLENALANEKQHTGKINLAGGSIFRQMVI